MRLCELFGCAELAAKLTTPRRRVELLIGELGVSVRVLARNDEYGDFDEVVKNRLGRDVVMDDDRAVGRLEEMIRDTAMRAPGP